MLIPTIRIAIVADLALLSGLVLHSCSAVEATKSDLEHFSWRGYCLEVVAVEATGEGRCQVIQSQKENGIVDLMANLSGFWMVDWVDFLDKENNWFMGLAILTVNDRFDYFSSRIRQSFIPQNESLALNWTYYFEKGMGEAGWSVVRERLESDGEIWMEISGEFVGGKSIREAVEHSTVSGTWKVRYHLMVVDQYGKDASR